MNISNSELACGVCRPHNTINDVGFLPLVPLILGGTALLGAGAIGYKVGKPEYDQSGRRVPGVTERAAEAVGKGVGNAITVSAVLVLGYLIFVRETNKRK